MPIVSEYETDSPPKTSALRYLKLDERPGLFSYQSVRFADSAMETTNFVNAGLAESGLEQTGPVG